MGEVYLFWAILLHVMTGLKRSWDISMNYTISSGSWNMLLSGLWLLSFILSHLTDLRFHEEFHADKPKATVFGWPGEFAWIGYIYPFGPPLLEQRDCYTMVLETLKQPSKVIWYTV